MMNKMLKLDILGVAACGVFALTGCGGDKASSTAASSASGQGALLQKIKKDGKLVVGTAPGFPPYEFLDTSVKDKNPSRGSISKSQKPLRRSSASSSKYRT